MSTTKQIANESELRFASEFVRKGYSVFLPYGEDSPVDLLIYKNQSFKRVQVKAAKPINGSISCYLRSSNNWQNKKYSKDDIDLFALYDYENKKGYLIPINKVDGMVVIKIRLTESKNNQKKKIRLAKDYLYF
jgi:hypothetical protein